MRQRNTDGLCMRYESESGTQVENPTERQLEELLYELDGVTDSFASLTAPNGSYIQVGGGPTAFTVELREVGNSGTFRHLKATLPNGGRTERHLIIGGERVSVRENQIIDAETMLRLFRTFLRSQNADASVEWEDITTMLTRKG